MEDELLTVDDFAEKYRVSSFTVRSWVKQGRIRYVLSGPRHLKRIKKTDAVKVMEVSDVGKGTTSEVRGPRKAEGDGGDPNGAGGPAPKP